MLDILEPFLNSGKQVQFSSITGKVASSSTRSDFSVSSSTSTTSSGRTYSVPHVSSVVKQQFFLLPEGGGEVPIQLSGVDVPVRDGQTVTMIAGGRRSDGKDNYWVRLVNHDTGRWYSLKDDGELRHTWKLVSKIRWELTLFSLMFIGTILFIAMLFSFAPPNTASQTQGTVTLWLISVLVTLGWLTVSLRRYTGLKNRLTGHLNMLSNAALAAKPRVIA